MDALHSEIISNSYSWETPLLSSDIASQYMCKGCQKKLTIYVKLIFVKYNPACLRQDQSSLEGGHPPTPRELLFVALR
jgi:hypothetical protein